MLRWASCWLSVGGIVEDHVSKRPGSSTVPALVCFGAASADSLWGANTVALMSCGVNKLAPQRVRRSCSPKHQMTLRVFAVAPPHQLSTRSVAASLGHFSVALHANHRRVAAAQRFVFDFAEMPTPDRCPFSRSSREFMPSVGGLSNTATGFVTNRCDKTCHKSLEIAAICKFCYHCTNDFSGH